MIQKRERERVSIRAWFGEFFKIFSQDPQLAVNFIYITFKEMFHSDSKDIDPDLYLNSLTETDKENLKNTLVSLAETCTQLKQIFPNVLYFVQAVGSTLRAEGELSRPLGDIDLRVIIDDPQQRSEAITHFIDILKEKFTDLEQRFETMDYTGSTAQGSYYYDYYNNDNSFIVSFGDALPIHISIASPNSFAIPKYIEAEREAKTLPRSVLFGNVDNNGNPLDG